MQDACIQSIYNRNTLVALTLLTLKSWVHLHPHRWIPGERGLEKIRIFCNVRLKKFVWRHQQDLSLWAYNNMIKSCALLVDNTKVMSRSHQGHFKVKLPKNIENTLFLSMSSSLGVQSSIRKDWWWHMLGRVSFQNTFFRKSRAVLILWGVMPSCLPLLHPHSSRLNWTRKIIIMQQRVASASASIAKDWYIIGYGGWHGLRLCITAWMPPKINVKVMSRSCKMSGVSVYGWCVLNA